MAVYARSSWSRVDRPLPVSVVTSMELRSGLSAMSYDLHAKLADEFGGREKWGYRTVDTLVSPSSRLVS